MSFRLSALAIAAVALIGVAASGVESHHSAGTPPGPPPGAHDEPGRRQLAPRGLGESGRVPGEVTVFNNQMTAVTKLDPALLAALRRAATDARRDGVTVYVTSGWRSAEYQEQL